MECEHNVGSFVVVFLSNFPTLCFPLRNFEFSSYNISTCNILNAKRMHRFFCRLFEIFTENKLLEKIHEQTFKFG